MKQRYICCAYISTNSKIYDILQVVRRRIFLALQTLPHILFKLHYHQLGLFASFLKICMVLDMF